MCGVNAVAAPGTEGMTQGELNDDLERQREDAVAEMRLGRVPTIYTRTVGGVKALAIISDDFTSLGEVRYRVIREQFIMYRPGRTFGIYCVSTAEDVAEARKLFDGIADTFDFMQ